MWIGKSTQMRKKEAKRAVEIARKEGTQELY